LAPQAQLHQQQVPALDFPLVVAPLLPRHQLHQQQVLALDFPLVDLPPLLLQMLHQQPTVLASPLAPAVVTVVATAAAAAMVLRNESKQDGRRSARTLA
jgi:hypothetical protein